MSYPEDKEYFRRVVNRNLPTIPGDTVDQDDQNKPASFLERLQDTLGFGITMGYATVREFFDEVQAKIAGLKKTEVIPLYGAGGPGLVNSGFWDEFGGSLTLLSTDIVIFMAYCNWRRYENTAAYITMRIQRGVPNISPLHTFQGIENQGNLSSSLNWTYDNPTEGTSNFWVRIYVEGGQAYLSRINFYALKTSI